jgi:hypothetical protein
MSLKLRLEDVKLSSIKGVLVADFGSSLDCGSRHRSKPYAQGREALSMTLTGLERFAAKGWQVRWGRYLACLS